MSLRYGSFLALGGPPGRASRGVLSCPSVRWGGLSGRASGGALATLVLDVAQSYIHISACACVAFVASLFANTNPSRFSSQVQSNTPVTRSQSLSVYKLVSIQRNKSW